MSAQLVLSDLEMETIIKCVRSVASRTVPPPALDGNEHAAVLRIAGKLIPHLDRKSRRRPKP